MSRTRFQFRPSKKGSHGNQLVVNSLRNAVPISPHSESERQLWSIHGLPRAGVRRKGVLVLIKEFKFWPEDSRTCSK